MSLICAGCGTEIETIPLQCAHNIYLNDETNQMECYMENCGTISINEFMCENCCARKIIMKLNKDVEQLALKNDEFKEELAYFKPKIFQGRVFNSDFTFWVEFGDGVYKYDKGMKDNPAFTVTCSHKTMLKVFNGQLEAFAEFLNGNLKIQGDLQYAVAFFDLLKLAAEISKEQGGV
ncbi:MAG: SCP2 sterol-binding domain-containing protein [Candidatus Hermodarchaeota archaeon]